MGKPYSKNHCQSISSLSFASTDNAKLPNTWFRLTDIPSHAPFDGLIGGNFFEKNLVYFDFDQHRIFVKVVSIGKT